MSIGCRSGRDRYRPTYRPSVDRVSVGRVLAECRYSVEYWPSVDMVLVSVDTRPNTLPIGRVSP